MRRDAQARAPRDMSQRYAGDARRSAHTAHVRLAAPTLAKTVLIQRCI